MTAILSTMEVQCVFLPCLWIWPCDLILTEEVLMGSHEERLKNYLYDGSQLLSSFLTCPKFGIRWT